MVMYFPYDSQRRVQAELIKDVLIQIEKKSHLIANAPTGLGKTAATLSPALSYAIENSLTVFFLTSRHTQHQIAIDTLKAIKRKFNLKFTATSIVGKSSMCLQPGMEKLSSSEFSDFCKRLKEEGKCEFYSRTRENNKSTVLTKKVVKELKMLSPNSSEEIISLCSESGICPYEMATILAKNSRVIVCDYYYVFNPAISETFFSKAGISLDKAILIIDEGHNLPSRARELLSNNLSDYTLKSAVREADKNKLDASLLIEIKSAFEDLAKGLVEEMPVPKNQFFDRISKIKNYQLIILELEQFADIVKEKQKKSFIGYVASFLNSWQGDDEGFARYIQKEYSSKSPIITLRYKCLDPSLITESIISKCYSAIIMSGTLSPTFMYKDLLKFPKNTLEKEYPSPFPDANRLVLVIPKTTTRFSMRNEQQYQKIAEYCARLSECIPGNIAMFFPSYALKDSVQKYFEVKTSKTVFSEIPKLSKQEKTEFLLRFKKYKDTGAVLLGATSGSFGEGIDLPGDLLNAVIIVGLPLGRPDIETKALINYYNQKFGKGWDYGYVLPAITKIMQNAGRCIRTETDRGLIVFLDERYVWSAYSRCFPREWDIKVKADFENIVKKFFRRSS